MPSTCLASGWEGRSPSFHPVWPHLRPSPPGRHSCSGPPSPGPGPHAKRARQLLCKIFTGSARGPGGSRVAARGGQSPAP